MPDALPAATLPIYHGLGQALSMLACIPSGLVEVVMIKVNCCTQNNDKNILSPAK